MCQCMIIFDHVMHHVFRGWGVGGRGGGGGGLGGGGEGGRDTKHYTFFIATA